jgi:hypothetical protein
MWLAAAAAPIFMIVGAAQAQEADANCLVGSGGYASIQSAVDDPACTVIAISAGTFLENVTIGRSLTLRGAGADRTTVDATGTNKPVFGISPPPMPRLPCDPPTVTVKLSGMTITGGSGPDATSAQRNGGGISASPGVKLTVEKSVVTGNSAYMNGGGISLVMGRLTIVHSLVSGNISLANPQPGPPNPDYIGGGGGVRIAGCPAVLVVQHSRIVDNLSYRHGGGILVNVPTPLVIGGASIPGPDGTLVVMNSQIMRNTAAEANGGGGIYTFRADLTSLDSQIKHNYPDDLRQLPSP